MVFHVLASPDLHILIIIIIIIIIIIMRSASHQLLSLLNRPSGTDLELKQIVS